MYFLWFMGGIGLAYIGDTNHAYVLSVGFFLMAAASRIADAIEERE